MAPLADNSYSPPQGMPIPAHDLRMASNGTTGSHGNISNNDPITSGTNISHGANPAPGWSSRTWPEYRVISS